MNNEHGPLVPPCQFVEDLHLVFGDNHDRATHAKGILLKGVFLPGKEAASLTKAFHLQDQPSTVLVRLSDNTGIPSICDAKSETNPRGMSIRFMMIDGRYTDVVCHSFNGFPAATTDEFHDLLVATWKSKGDVLRPTPLDIFYETHPRAKIFNNICTLPASFSSLIYYGVNAFKFTNRNGETHFVRYQFHPEEGEAYVTEKQAAAAGSNYMFEEIHRRLPARPFRFHYFAQLSGDGDKIDDPSLAWPDSRPRYCSAR
ncbi:catalase [Puia sp. P3]|uniref:catalase n=1 Tax=Puia sp. P3 TaxID=3423952 RepID=UPI003D679866